MPTVPADESASLIAVIHLSVPWKARPHKHGGSPTRAHHDLFPMFQSLLLLRERIIRLVKLPPGSLDEPFPVCWSGKGCGQGQQFPGGAAQSSGFSGPFCFVVFLVRLQLTQVLRPRVLARVVRARGICESEN